MTEPWRFIRTGRATREQLGNVQARLKDKGRTPSDDALARAREKFLGSAELLVLCRVVHADPNVAREDYAAIACAASQSRAHACEPVHLHRSNRRVPDQLARSSPVRRATATASSFECADSFVKTFCT